MKENLWIVVGATSAIAEAFARMTAAEGAPLLLVARNIERLKVLQADIRLRYKTPCDILACDLAKDSTPLLHAIENLPGEVFLFLAQGLVLDNNVLDKHTIDNMLAVNSASVIHSVHTCLQRAQNTQQIVFLSSVAGMRGRARNSLYGGTKSAVEVYLQGLQQESVKNRHITIARLGFIDTQNTFGLKGAALAISPERAARACLHAIRHKKRMVYIPFFWRIIMGVIVWLPFWMFKRLWQL
ncbi:SDR family NAD(P)-dependent oxidoreductase [Legionella geestiana]|uniref:SDR family NAD(P)-dependent oxidoreductase n=1 Tax=Legionella geestiana TaxID=45065 RepID=UPI001091BDD6|nr:SDR family NAD(P)-dependent oxidoreductase [Legionella geestiana]QDQ39321.1 SDR family NAD(P)-dependent oxidoreductase [Legionella geestiana]